MTYLCKLGGHIDNPDKVKRKTKVVEGNKTNRWAGETAGSGNQNNTMHSAMTPSNRKPTEKNQVSQALTTPIYGLHLRRSGKWL